MPVNPVEHPVLEPISQRFSPYRFEPRPIETDKLRCCFEAARWAASSFNDQPWFFLLAVRQDLEEFQRMIGCLGEANQGWANNAGAVVLTAIRTTFAYNEKPNRVALHDLGQAAAYLALQATALGLQVHQMAGVDLAKVRSEYEIPDGFAPQTGIAIGYPDTSPPQHETDQEWHDRETGARTRKPLAEQVFGSQWSVPAKLMS